MKPEDFTKLSRAIQDGLGERIDHLVRLEVDIRLNEALRLRVRDEIERQIREGVAERLDVDVSVRLK